MLGRLLPKVIPTAISLGKKVLVPLGLSAAMSGIDGAIQKSMFGSGPTIGNNKLNDIIKICNSGLSDMTKIIKVLEDHDVLPKGITRTAKNEVKSQRGVFYQC